MTAKELSQQFEKRIMEIYEEENKHDERWASGLKYAIKVLKSLLEYIVPSEDY